MYLVLALLKVAFVNFTLNNILDILCISSRCSYTVDFVLFCLFNRIETKYDKYVLLQINHSNSTSKPVVSKCY